MSNLTTIDYNNEVEEGEEVNQPVGQVRVHRVHRPMPIRFAAPIAVVGDAGLNIIQAPQQAPVLPYPTPANSLQQLSEERPSSSEESENNSLQ